jgi:hypothetical protein
MSVKQLLDFIAKYESRGNYNVVWGGIKQKHRPGSLVKLTVGQVLNWQDSIDPLYMSEAAGRYQIMEDTLRELVSQGYAAKSDLYDEGTQDRLAIALLKRRGLDSYMSGKITAEKFANFIAREWASMPVVSGAKKGRSYYAGDGLNKSHTPVADFMAAVVAAKASDEFVRPDAPTPTTSAPAVSAGLVAAILAAVVAFFTLRKG